MDFRTLRYFVTVAEELNFTRAAERLHMSQPPLSSQIRQLEQDLGAQLFIRSKRKLALTDEGRALLRRSRQILDLGELTRREIGSMTGELSGQITIGMVEGRAPFLASRWIQGFTQEYPMVTYSLRNGSGDEMIELLEHGLIDLAVIAEPFDLEELDSLVVGREPWVAMIPITNPLAAEVIGSQVPLSLVAQQKLIIPQRKSRIEAIERWFSGIGQEPDVLCTLSSYIDALALVEQGMGVAIFPQTTYTPNPHIVSKVIVSPSRYVQYDLVWKKGEAPGGAAAAFIDYVRDFLEEDRMHQAPFQVREREFVLPRDATQL